MAERLAGQLAPFDWTRTRAFFGVHSDLWLNLEGREPQGIVADRHAEPLIDELSCDLLDLTDPTTGAPLVAAVYRRDEIFSGPHAALAPDLIVDTWSTGYRVAPGRVEGGDLVARPEALAGVRESWSSDHRPVGIFVAVGPGIARGASKLHLHDICPTALALLDQPVPDGLNGAVAADVIDPFLQAHPVRRGSQIGGRDGSEGGYSDDEAAAVAAHLKDLGYIE